jgi:hypothetical protein
MDLALGSLAGARAADPIVERGRYLITIASRIDCHKPGHTLGKPDMACQFAGSDVGFEIPGLGVFYGPNLTPDKETGLGDAGVTQTCDLCWHIGSRFDRSSQRRAFNACMHRPYCGEPSAWPRLVQISASLRTCSSWDTQPATTSNVALAAPAARIRAKLIDTPTNRSATPPMEHGYLHKCWPFGSILREVPAGHWGGTGDACCWVPI